MHGSVRPAVTKPPAPALREGESGPVGRLLPKALLLAVAGSFAAGAGAFVLAGVPAMAGAALATFTVGLAAAAWARRVDREQEQLLDRLASAEAARERAQADNLAKSRFLAEMSHELRTPLNTVMGFSEMMADEVLGPHRVPAYGGYARDILASGRHLLALADDLLDLARIESGHRVLLETPVHLNRLGQECLAMLRPDATARRLTLRQEDLDGVPVRLWGDERAVRQIILNLMANAVKFTPSGGEVRLVSGLDVAGAPFLAVEDTGAGVSESELPLEDARHRESRLDVKSGRGAGLGLAIVRALATLHGGELTLTRRASGGTCARVVFPKSRALGTPAEPPRA